MEIVASGALAAEIVTSESAAPETSAVEIVATETVGAETVEAEVVVAPPVEAAVVVEAVAVETRPDVRPRPQVAAPRFGRHLATRARLIATLAAAALVAMLVRDRGELMHAVSKLNLKPGVLAAGAAGALKKEPAVVAPLATAAVVTQSDCPAEMALVVRDQVRVCVDRWEASLVEVMKDGDEIPWSPYLALDELASSGRKVRAVSRPGVIPQGYIDRETAALTCKASGKRLCDAAEWVAACEGPRKTTYPYGNEADDKACNTHGRSPIGELFGASFKDHLYDSKVMNDPSLNALEGTVAKTGTYEKCTNGFGIYDMVGNLHEWTSEKNGVFHGGYYQDATQNGAGCHYNTSAHLATYHDYSTGFRCCKDAAEE